MRVLFFELSKNRLGSALFIVITLLLYSFSFAFGEGLELQILHVNDTHSALSGLTGKLTPGYNEEKCIAGLARISYEIKKAKKENNNVIALDAGDRFQKSLFFSLFRWSPVAEANKKIPWDAAVLGNHEFDDGCESLSNFLKEIPHPVLAANLRPSEKCPLSSLNLPPYVIINIRQTPVAIIGMTTILDKGFSRPCPNMKMEASDIVLTREINKLQQRGIKHIILLSHLGFNVDKKLARTINGIDVIVGGHTHTYLGERSKHGPYPVVERSPEGNPVLIVSAKSFTQYLGKLSVSFNEEGIPVKWSGFPMNLMKDNQRDPEVSAVVQRYEKAIREYSKDIVGKIQKDLSDETTLSNKEDFTGMIIANAMLEYGRPYGAVASFITKAALRASLSKRKISRADLADIIRFNNLCTVISLKGETLLKALAWGVISQKKKNSRLLNVAGMRYTFSGKGKKARIINAEIADEHGVFSPIIPEQEYAVVCTEDLRKGSLQFDMLQKSRVLSSPAVSLRYIVEQYIRHHSPLSSSVTEGITNIDGK